MREQRHWLYYGVICPLKVPVVLGMTFQDSLHAKLTKGLINQSANMLALNVLFHNLFTGILWFTVKHFLTAFCCLFFFLTKCVQNKIRGD